MAKNPEDPRYNVREYRDGILFGAVMGLFIVGPFLALIESSQLQFEHHVPMTTYLDSPKFWLLTEGFGTTVGILMGVGAAVRSKK